MPFKSKKQARAYFTTLAAGVESTKVESHLSAYSKEKRCKNSCCQQEVGEGTSQAISRNRKTKKIAFAVWPTSRCTSSSATTKTKESMCYLFTPDEKEMP